MIFCFRANDQVLKVDNMDVSKVDCMVAVQALKSSGNRINMVSMSKPCNSQKLSSFPDQNRIMSSESLINFVCVLH